MPSQTYAGSFERNVNYHPSTNPVVTVVWRIPEPLPAGAERSFYVYFDSLLSSDPKEARDYSASLLGGDQLGLFWSGWGTTSYGLSRPIDGKASALTVVARDGPSDVVVSAASPGQPFTRLESFRLAGPMSFHQVTVPGTSMLVLKVEASAPVLTQATSAGFVPSLDAGMAGRDFVFALTHPAAWEQDTVYFAATNPADVDGLLQETTIEITRLDGTMSPVRFALGGSTNPRDYSVGARASIEQGNCVRPVPGAESPTLPFGPGLYRARVLSGERVLLQYQAVDGLSQAPSDTGAPTGTRFLAAIGWSDEKGAGVFCPRVETRPGTMYAANLGTAVVLNATSDDLVFQAYPRGSPSPVTARYPPGRPLSEPYVLQGPFDITARDSADRMLLVSSTGPMHLLVGQGKQQVGVQDTNPAPFANPAFGVSTIPVVNGPLGGSHGARSFLGSGPAILVSPYDGNAVTLDLHYSSGWQSKGLTLSKDTIVELTDASSSNSLLGYRVKSRFPLAVNPALATSGTYAAIPAALHALPVGADYRGYLLDLSSPDGEPATRSTPPGTAVSYPVQLTNLARAADGTPLDDQATVTADAPQGWTVTLDGAAVGTGKAINLGPGESRTMTVSVRPPADVPVDTTEAVTLRATSAGNDRVGDALQLVTFVKTVYQIGLWFDAVDGPKEQEIQVDDQGRAVFSLVLRNGGSKLERIQVSAALRGGTGGWDLTLEGEPPLLELDVPPGPEGVPLTLALEAPEGIPEAEATAVVTAKVIRSPASKDAVQATAVRRAPADVQLEAPRLTAFTLPGQAAVFPVGVSSSGGGTIRLEVQSETGTGWLQPRLERGTPPANVTTLTLTAGQKAQLQLAVTPTPGALAGNTTTVRVAAIDRDGNVREAVFFVKVLPRHAVSVHLPATLPSVPGPGSNGTFSIRWANGGNLDERLSLTPGDLPVGWALTLAPEILVARGSSQTVTIKVAVPTTGTTGVHNVSIVATSHDGNRSTAALQVHVDDTVRAGLVQPSLAILGQPGKVTGWSYTVTNNGTTPLKVVTTVAPGEPWPLEPVPDIVLKPNQALAIPIRWLVPLDAPDGASTHRVQVQFHGEGDVLPATQVDGVVHVARADLGFDDVQVTVGPAGGLVRATISNAGQRPAKDFDLLLVDASGLPIDKIRVARLEPGTNVTVTLALPQSLGTLILDAGATVVETDEANNHAQVSAGLQHDAPNLHWSVLLLALALLASRGRPVMPRRPGTAHAKPKDLCPQTGEP